MNLAEAADLVINLKLNNQAAAGLKGVEGSLGRIKGLATKGVATAATNITRIGVVAAGAVGAAVFSGIQSLEELERVTEGTKAVIESTGGVAGVSAEEVQKYAQALEDTTTADDKAIQSAENLLLTFTGIGKDVFPDATKAVVDLGIAMAEGDVNNADFKSSAIQVGKALNDPIAGISALTRVGVSFTQQQKDQIKAMVEAGDKAGAQAIILKELETEFGNAGEAAGKGFGGDMRRFQDALEEAKMALAEGFLPVLREVSTFLKEKLSDPGVITAIKDFGKDAAGALHAAFEGAKNIPWQQVGDAFKLMGQGAKAAFDIFTSMPPWVQTAVLTGWGLNKLTGGALSGIVGELGKGLVKGVLGMTAGVVNAQAGVVNVNGPVAGGGAPAGGTAPVATGSRLANAAVTVGGTVAIVDQLTKLPGALEGFSGAVTGLTNSDLPAAKDGIQTFIDNISDFNPFSPNKGLLQMALDSTSLGTLNNPAWVPDLTTQIKSERQENDAAYSTIATKLAPLDPIAAATSGALNALNGQIQVTDPAIAALGPKLDANKDGVIRMGEATAAQLGLTVGELRALKVQSGGDTAILAGKLGISVEELIAIRQKSAAIATLDQAGNAELRAIKNKEWKTTVNLTTKFNVSAREVASAVRQYTLYSGRTAE